VIDEVTQDTLLQAGYDARERARMLVVNFKQFLVDNKDELEALRIFYSVPYRAGLKFKAVKELAEMLKRPPLNASPERLWHAFASIEPQAVRGQCGKLVDLIALVRHALDPNLIIEPFGNTVEERYQAWLTTKPAFTAAQRQWLDAIKEHIKTSLTIEADDFELSPFAQLGGLGKAHDLFGNELNAILDELNTRLAV
jgi:type I restriction enzyme R subunit